MLCSLGRDCKSRPAWKVYLKGLWDTAHGLDTLFIFKYAVFQKEDNVLRLLLSNIHRRIGIVKEKSFNFFTIYDLSYKCTITA